jgi:hypothetical protein
MAEFLAENNLFWETEEKRPQWFVTHARVCTCKFTEPFQVKNLVVLKTAEKAEPQLAPAHKGTNVVEKRNRKLLA